MPYFFFLRISHWLETTTVVNLHFIFVQWVMVVFINWHAYYAIAMAYSISPHPCYTTAYKPPIIRITLGFISVVNAWQTERGWLGSVICCCCILGAGGYCVWWWWEGTYRALMCARLFYKVMTRIVEVTVIIDIEGMWSNGRACIVQTRAYSYIAKPCSIHMFMFSLDTRATGVLIMIDSEFLIKGIMLIHPDGFMY